MKQIFSAILGFVMTIFSHQVQPVAIQPTPVKQVIVAAPISTPKVEVKTEAPKSKTVAKSTQIVVKDVVIPKTETEQDNLIDQNTIKNIEQDSRLDSHGSQISDLTTKIGSDPQITNLQKQVNDLQNQVTNLQNTPPSVPIPIPQPVPQPGPPPNPITPSCTLTATDYITSLNGDDIHHTTLTWTSQGIPNDTQGYLRSALRGYNPPDFEWGYTINPSHGIVYLGTPISLNGSSIKFEYAYDYKAIFGDVSCTARTVDLTNQ